MVVKLFKNIIYSQISQSIWIFNKNIIYLIYLFIHLLHNYLFDEVIYLFNYLFWRLLFILNNLFK